MYSESELDYNQLYPFTQEWICHWHSQQSGVCGNKWCYSRLIVREYEVIVPGQVAHYQGTVTDSAVGNATITVSRMNLQPTRSVNGDLKINLKAGSFYINYFSRLVWIYLVHRPLWKVMTRMKVTTALCESSQPPFGHCLHFSSLQK